MARPSAAGPAPRGGRQWTARAAGADKAPGGVPFGAVLVQPAQRYQPGEQVVVRFVGANPNHNLRRGGSYLHVQRHGANWAEVADDNDWSTRFHWCPDGAGGCTITVTWDVPAEVEPGRYRITYSGDARDPGGQLTQFTGITREFSVGNP